MKLFYYSILIALVFNPLSILSQSFGETGSYWKYDYEPHDGNGGGWEMLQIKGDSVLNGNDYKILHRTYYYQQSLPPLLINQGNGVVGLMSFINDSVFIDDKLLFSFRMELGDTLDIEYVDDLVQMKLVLDSIGLTSINGQGYKTWYGKKLCGMGGVFDPYEDFTLVDQIGQINGGYLLWNTDNCIIGGGLNHFDCHSNDNFSFPFDEACDEMTLSNKEQLFSDSSIRVGPNPVNDELNITSQNFEILEITIIDLQGREVHKESSNLKKAVIDIKDFKTGFYAVQIRLSNQQVFRQMIVVN